LKPESPEPPMDISQWWLPPARQHAGPDDAYARQRGTSAMVSSTNSTAMEIPRLMSSRILAHHALV
jgi:hypothetical protein